MPRRCREAVSDDVLGWRFFEYGLTCRFEPCVAVEFSVQLVTDPKNNPCSYAVAREVPVKNRGAFPANRFEVQHVGRE